jgi:hypothetical protein
VRWNLHMTVFTSWIYMSFDMGYCSNYQYNLVIELFYHLKSLLFWPVLSVLLPCSNLGNHSPAFYHYRVNYQNKELTVVQYCLLTFFGISSVFPRMSLFCSKTHPSIPLYNRLTCFVFSSCLL